MMRTAEQPRLLAVVASNQRRGAEVQAERTCTALASLGWEVDLMALSAAPEPTIGAVPLGPPRPGSLGRLRPDIVWRWRAAIESRKPHAVLAWGGATLRYTAVATVGARPQVLDYVATGIASDWIRSRAHAAWYRALVRRFHRVIAVSERTRDDLVEAVGLDADMITVIPSGVPETLLDLEPSPAQEALRLLFVGSLSDEKDPGSALAVVERAARRAPVTLRLVGTGPLEAAMASAARHSPALVEIVGAVDDVTPHLSWADALVITSRTEGLPGVALEAMAAAVPVLGYDVGALGEAVSVRSGVLVAPGDVDALAAAAVRLCRDREHLAEMGRRARAEAAERFLIGRSVAAFDSVLRAQLASRTITTDVSPR